MMGLIVISRLFSLQNLMAMEFQEKGYVFCDIIPYNPKVTLPEL